MDERAISCLDNWIEAELWRASHAKTVFPTSDSWTWFKRRNRRALVEEGVLVLGSGRVCDSVDINRIGAVVQTIRRRESIARIDRGHPTLYSQIASL